jgi:hypothetical protein
VGGALVERDLPSSRRTMSVIARFQESSRFYGPDGHYKSHRKCKFEGMSPGQGFIGGLGPSAVRAIPEAEIVREEHSHNVNDGEGSGESEHERRFKRARPFASSCKYPTNSSKLQN